MSRHCAPLPPQTPLWHWLSQQSPLPEHVLPLARHEGALQVPLVHIPVQQSLAALHERPGCLQFAGSALVQTPPEQAKLQHSSKDVQA